MLKLSSFFLTVFIFASSMQAIAEDDSVSQKSTQKGIYEIGGSFAFASNVSGTTIIIRPEVGYFFWDRTLLGFSGSIENSSFTTSGAVGLTASRYFNVEKNYATFVTQSVSTTYSQPINSQSGSTGLGVAVFLNPNVAFKTIGSLGYPLKGEVTFTSGVSGSLSFYF